MFLIVMGVVLVVGTIVAVRLAFSLGRSAEACDQRKRDLDYKRRMAALLLFKSQGEGAICGALLGDE